MMCNRGKKEITIRSTKTNSAALGFHELNSLKRFTRLTVAYLRFFCVQMISKSRQPSSFFSLFFAAIWNNKSLEYPVTLCLSSINLQHLMAYTQILRSTQFHDE